MHALEKEVSSDVDAASANADPWGVAGAIEAFNVLEYCVRYTDRLSKEIYAAVGYHCICSLFRASVFPSVKKIKNICHAINKYQGKTVFETSEDEDSSRASAAGRGATGRGATSQNAKSVHLSSTEMDKLRLCKEDFDETKMAFNSVNICASTFFYSSVCKLIFHFSPSFQTLRQGAERLASAAQSIMKDTIVAVLGKSGPYKGLRYYIHTHTHTHI